MTQTPATASVGAARARTGWEGLLQLLGLLSILHCQGVQVLRGATQRKDRQLSHNAAGATGKHGIGRGRTREQRILNLVKFFFCMIFTEDASLRRAVWRKSRISLICLGCTQHAARTGSKRRPTAATGHQNAAQAHRASKMPQGAGMRGRQCRQTGPTTHHVDCVVRTGAALLADGLKEFPLWGCDRNAFRTPLPYPVSSGISRASIIAVALFAVVYSSFRSVSSKTRTDCRLCAVVHAVQTPPSPCSRTLPSSGALVAFESAHMHVQLALHLVISGIALASLRLHRSAHGLRLSPKFCMFLPRQAQIPATVP